MPDVTGALNVMGTSIERHAGPEIRAQVMADSEALGATPKPPRVALWMKGALERLDAAVDVATRNAIMVDCGHNCFDRHASNAARIRARRGKFATEDEFLDAELRNPPTGTRLEREGNVLYQIYTPRTWSHPTRCYCSLMRGLPDEQTSSGTYCQCSRGFVERTWEFVLGRPVRVELVESSISGAQECRFAICL